MIDSVFLYKLIHNCVDSIDLLSEIQFRIPDTRTRMDNKGLFHCKKAQTEILKKSPIWRMCFSYNKLCGTKNEVDIFNQSQRSFQNNLIKLF